MYTAPEMELTYLLTDDILTSSIDGDIWDDDGKPGDNPTEDDEL